MDNKKGPRKPTVMTPRRNDPLALANQTPNIMKRSYKDVMMEKNLEKMRVVETHKRKVSRISPLPIIPKTNLTSLN